MSSLTQQIKEIKDSHNSSFGGNCCIKKRKEEESSIEHLEALVEPLTHALDSGVGEYHPPNLRNYGWRTYRNDCEEKYEYEMKIFHDGMKECRSTCDFQYVEGYPHPQKNKQLFDEEIYTTIIGIFKKQREEIKNQREEIKNLKKRLLLSHAWS